MAITLQQVIQTLEDVAPPWLAESWDRVGLTTGHPSHPVERAVLCLDVSPEVVNEALEWQAGLLVSHHPLIWEPLATLREDWAKNALLVRLLRSGLAHYALHTNWDKAPRGVSDYLARTLGLEELEVLQPADVTPYYKLVVFVPRGHEDQVREALARAGAGHLGNYSHCTFQAAGTGTFKPLDGAHPFLGSVGELERAEEYRLETIVPRWALSRALEAMLRVHPYEEVAYDLYPLGNRVAGAGLGRLGRLPAPVPLPELAGRVKAALGADRVRLVAEQEQPVQRVAVCPGAGAELLPLARRRGAEVLVTGDLKYHQAREAQGLGLPVIDAGHYATEAVALPSLAEYLKTTLPGLEVRVSQAEAPPWREV